MAEHDPNNVDTILHDLAALGGKQRGTPLRSDDWNTLVDAVRGLAMATRARALASADALAAGYAPAEHEHLHEVGLTWLDEVTRALVEGRRGVDFTVRDELQRLDRGAATLREQVEGLRGELGGLRDLVLQLRDEVIGGNRDLGKVKLRVEALRDVEVGVGRIGRDFDALGGRLEQVLALRAKIGDGEGQVDLVGLGHRIGALEQMRAQLIGDSPAPDLRALQQDLIKVSDRVGRAGPAAPIDLSEASKIQLRQIVDAELATAKVRLEALDGRTALVEATLGKQATRLERLVDYDVGLTRLDALAGQIVGHAGKLGELDAHAVGVEGKLAGLDGKLTGLDGAVTKKLAGIAQARGVDIKQLTDLGSRLDQVAGGFATLDGKLAALGDLDGRFVGRQAFEQLGGSVAALGNDVAVRTARLETLELGVAEAGAGLDDLGRRLGQLGATTATLGAWRGSIDLKLGELARLGGGESAAAVSLRLAEVESTLGTWNTWRTGAVGRMDALEVKTAGAEEARIALATQVAAQAAAVAGQGAQLGGLRAGLDGLVGWRGAIDGELETLNVRAGTLESWRGGAAGSLDHLTASVAGLTDHKARLEALETGTGALGNWRSSVDGTLGKLAGRLEEQAAFSGRLGALEGLQLGKVDARMATLEGSLGALQTAQKSAAQLLDGHSAGLVELSGTLSALGKDLGTTRTMVKGLGEAQANTNNLMGGLGGWRVAVDAKLAVVETRQAAQVEWQGGVNQRLTTVDQSLGSLGAVHSRIDSLETATKNVALWQNSTNAALGDLQINVAKARELGTRLDKVDSQLLGLNEAQSKLIQAARPSPGVAIPVRRPG